MSFILLCLAVIPVCVFPIRRVGELLMRRALGMQQKVGKFNRSFKGELVYSLRDT